MKFVFAKSTEVGLFIVDSLKSGQGDEAADSQIVRQGEATPYWFKLIHYKSGLDCQDYHVSACLFSNGRCR